MPKKSEKMQTSLLAQMALNSLHKRRFSIASRGVEDNIGLRLRIGLKFFHLLHTVAERGIDGTSCK